MGSDMCIAYVVYNGIDPTDLDDNCNAKSKMLSKLNSMNISRQDWIEFIDVFGDIDSTDQSINSILRKKAETTINEFFECVSNRDVTWIYVAQKYIILSGGMSGGDSPTDSYDTIMRFGMLPNELLASGGFE